MSYNPQIHPNSSHVISYCETRNTFIIELFYNIIVVAQMKCLDIPVVVLMFPIWEVVDPIAYCVNGKVLQHTVSMARFTLFL